MPAEFFGGGGGYVAGVEAEKDIASTQLMQATTGLHLVETQQKQMELDTDRRLMQLMQQRNQVVGQVTGQLPGQPGQPILQAAAPPTSVSGQLVDTAMTMYSAGAFKRANPVMRAAAGAAIMEKNQFETDLLKRKETDQLLGGITDQASLDRALPRIEQLNGPNSPLRNQPYDPVLIQHARDSLQTSTDQALIDERKSRNEMNKPGGTLDKLRKARTIEAEASTSLKAAREAQLGKTGKILPSPTIGDVAAAQTIVAGAHPELTGNALTEAAHLIASGAKALQSKNTALDSDTALRQSFANEEKAGSFTVNKGGFFSSDKGTFIPGGKSPADALPVTKAMQTGKGKGMVPGRYYYDPSSGNVGQWTGKGLRRVAPIDRASQVGAGAGGAGTGGGGNTDQQDLESLDENAGEGGEE